jgi:hypothetical protein
VSVITLGVSDLSRSRRFYEALGWTSRSDPGADVVFFESGGMILSLWDRGRLAEDSGVPDDGAFGGVTLAQNVGSEAEVDAVIATAARAGATVSRPPAETFWGGYSGCFVDPDGHPWEIAYNPHWTLAEDGSVALGS